MGIIQGSIAQKHAGASCIHLTPRCLGTVAGCRCLGRWVMITRMLARNELHISDPVQDCHVHHSFRQWLGQDSCQWSKDFRVDISP